MNYVDFTILLIAVIGFLYGLIKGVIRQVGSLGGFIAGIVVSRFFGNSFSALLREMFDLPEGVSRVIAYSLLFLIVYIICVQLMRLIHHITHHVALGWLDRLAGALFGAVKYLVIMNGSCERIFKGCWLPGGRLPARHAKVSAVNTGNVSHEAIARGGRQF